MNSVPKAGWREVLLYAIGRRRQVRVNEASMMPTLQAGDRLLVDEKASVAVGDIVVVRNPEDNQMMLVKRVTAVSSHALTVHGDNLIASRDSRQFGDVPSNLIVGKVTSRIS